MSAHERTSAHAIAILLAIAATALLARYIALKCVPRPAGAILEYEDDEPLPAPAAGGSGEAAATRHPAAGGDRRFAAVRRPAAGRRPPIAAADRSVLLRGRILRPKSRGTAAVQRRIRRQCGTPETGEQVRSAHHHQDASF